MIIEGVKPSGTLHLTQLTQQMSWDWLDVRYVFIAVELFETMSSEGARAKLMEWMEGWNDGRK